MPEMKTNPAARTGLSLLAALLVLALAGAAWAGDNQQAQAQAQRWLGLLGQGEYGAAYDLAAPILQKAATPQKWQKLMSELAAKTGPAQGRKLLRGQAVTDLPGAPKGEYYLLLYSPGFAKMPQALEQVALIKGADGKWRVAGYYLR
ncbi:MAG: DUF4019 domain-containing protein [Proteobacteria bacterium]|nr:DUF4019 domain-containing protein [Pseudomonadota bacterium]MBU1450335.1 DUF4019 domain-containing protein [Pseudomonadota bacterium]MBU2470742.1 DUF4019 domain-containing protein [Pseudomonadota bacterium]MBU2518471.1 DUF4019 domain-containing protein [Pseudomonadota bacterium]